MERNRSLLGLFGFFLFFVFTLSSCGGGGGGGEAGGGSGSVPTGNPSVLAKVSAPAPPSECPTGGIAVDTGIDDNKNGLLDPGEIDLTQYVCNGTNGSNGANGISALVSISNEPSGTNCTNGGSRVSVGPDANVNGILDAAEITSTNYICNGANGTNGTNGTDGANSLVSITTEPVGANCTTGGLKVVSWLDTTANGSLDVNETSFTNYICNTPGTVVIQSITANPAVVRPGAEASLRVEANDGVGTPLTYQWAGPGSFSFASSATTTWTAPSTVGSYLVSVLVSNGVSTVTGYASILISAAPTGPIITSVSPSEARAGDTVLITGAGFGATRGTSTVSIGGVTATSITSWSEYQIRAVVPSGASTGSVIITVGGVPSSPGYIVILWNSSLNVSISAAANDQLNPQLVPDGNGGAIIVWEDLRGGLTTDIYAQRVNRTGSVQWGANGIAVSTAVNDQRKPRLVSDGSGGAIIVWEDHRSGTFSDIYAQRVNTTGIAQWTANGISISTAANNQWNPRIVADGSGGAIIAWEDRSTLATSGIDIYAQRVNSAGIVQWTANGVSITAAANDQLEPQLVPDGIGGAIAVWQDTRSGTIRDVYAQRVNSAGAVQWTADGVAICTAAGGSKRAHNVVTDGSGGAIIAWADFRSGTTEDIYAQRVNGAGVVQWSLDGVAISTALGYQSTPQLVYDGIGGAIIAWMDTRNADRDIYAQRVSSTGVSLWTGNGVAISIAAEFQQNPQVITDESGGAIIAWQDARSGTSDDIYAQRVDSNGNMQWTSDDGVAIATATFSQDLPQLVSDGVGGAIIAWQDQRSGNYDIFAQGITADGTR